MAMGQSLQFPGASIDKYDEVQDALGWHDATGPPKVYSHTPQERPRMASAWWNGGRQRAIGTSSSRRGSCRRSRRSATFLSLK